MFKEFITQFDIKVHDKLNLFHQFKNGKVLSRGVLSKSKIEQGQELCRVPIRACLGSHELCETFSFEKDGKDCLTADKFNAWTRSVRPKVSDFVLLVLRLAYEISRKDKSPWKPYFDLLPSAEHVLKNETSLVLFSDDEGKLFAGTCLEPLINDAVFEANFSANILPWLSQCHEKGFCDSDHLSLDSFKYKCWMLVSRGFHLGVPTIDPLTETKQPDSSSKKRKQSEAEPIKGYFLVPVVDMLNHAESNASHTMLRYPTDIELAEANCAPCFRLIAERPIKAIEQIFNNYGDLSNAQLLQSFGFLIEEGTPADQFVIQCATVSNSLKEFFCTDYMPNCSNNKVDALIEKRWSELKGTKLLHGGSKQTCFFISSECEPIDRNLLAIFVYFLLETDEERRDYLQLVEQTLPGTLGDEFWSDFKSEIEFLIEDVIAKKLVEFSQDTIAFEKLASDCFSGSPRAQLAIKYRKIEQRLILNLFESIGDEELYEDLLMQYFPDSTVCT